MAILWHVTENNGLSGGNDPRQDWFENKSEAEQCKKKWLDEHRQEADEILENLVEVKKITVPAKRAELVRWLFANNVRIE